MDIKQTVDLTYDKVDEIDKKINRVMSTTQSSSSNTNIQTTLTELDTKVDTINSNMSTLSDNLSQISSQTQKIDTINNNVTTINSNTATTNNNVNTIKEKLDKVQDALASKSEINILSQKIDEILQRISLSNNEETFETDPFKLNQEYTSTIETQINPTNEDSIEINESFSTSKYFFICPIYCNNSSFNYNLTFTFSCTEKIRIIWASTFDSSYTDYEAGTHTINISKNDVAVKNNKILFAYYVLFSSITLTYLKLDVFGTDITIYPKRHKYKVVNSYDKVIITKLENGNGYFKVLNTNLLKPSLLNTPYTLAQENIIDFSYTFDIVSSLNNKYSLNPIVQYISKDYTKTNNYGNNYRIIKFVQPYLDCSLGATYGNYNYATSVCLNYGTSFSMLFFQMSSSGSYIESSGGKKTLQRAVASCLVNDMSHFNLTEKYLGISTDISGINYFYISSSNFELELGYGKYVTAFYDKVDEYKINVYMNDGGYCIKYVLSLASDRKSATLLSKKIIGTYDAYFETNSEIYFVEKNNVLYMFKNED